LGTILDRSGATISISGAVRAGEVYAFLAGMKFGVLIERDGVLNKVRVERQHQVTPLTSAEFHINPEAVVLLKKLRAAGMLLIATTNQPGLSTGDLCRRELDRMHEMLRRALPLNDIFVCPHAEIDQCPCRKPKAGLLIEAKFKWHLDMDRSFVISDKWQDAEAARAAGCTSVILKSPWVGSVHHDFLLADLATAVDKILQLHTSGQPVVA
jgi:D-glycero-D-manno-heptose 1,7-bisphosphate phosphatase